MVLRSFISSGQATPKPRRAPAMERDLEKVPVTKRFLYLRMRGPIINSDEKLLGVVEKATIDHYLRGKVVELHKQIASLG